jgi:hypothetical protein
VQVRPQRHRRSEPPQAAPFGARARQLDEEERHEEHREHRRARTPVRRAEHGDRQREQRRLHLGRPTAPQQAVHQRVCRDTERNERDEERQVPYRRIDRVHRDLGQPFVVRPFGAGDAEREDVVPRDPSSGDDVLTGPSLPPVVEIHRLHERDDRRCKRHEHQRYVVQTQRCEACEHGAPAIGVLDQHVGVSTWPGPG